LAAVFLGCGHADDQSAAKKANAGPTVRVVQPTRRTIDYSVDQPGFVNAFEQTSIFSKVSGFLQQYYVDIGSPVKKGDLLAEIFVPELGEEHQQRLAQVELDKRQVEQAGQLVAVAQSSVAMAAAQLAEAKANVGKYEAEVVRWSSEVKRLAQMVQEHVVDQQILTETQRQLASAEASRAAAQAAVTARAADVAAAQANLGKAKIDVQTREAEVKVDEAAARRAAALLAYTKVTAPYDGVVTVRNANTGDYVQAVAGDKSAPNPSAMFVVARTDWLRIFVDVPENYARYVDAGTKAVVRAEALSGLQIPASVTRTSWAIRENTRTLRAEIDLARKEYDGLRPGMYVFAKVLVQRPGVFALPQQALLVSGNQTYCFLLESGRAVRTPVTVGVSDGTWTEIVKLKVGQTWRSATGNEQAILADLNELTDSQRVQVGGQE
jgi:HlyD family secretion protein